MPTIMTFSEAIKDSERHSKRRVLLGNGFSIACEPKIFVYKKLFENADFSSLSASAKAAFDALGTSDFEKVIKALNDAAKILATHGEVAKSVVDSIKHDADGLKELLVQTIAASHPERPGDIPDYKYIACRQFLANFETTYTLNYDLLLYWAFMHTEEGKEPTSDDGFRKPSYDYDADYVTWESSQSHDQNIFYMHGALHVFDSGTEVKKYTWKNTGVRLIEQTRDALSKGFFPLFVSEGTSEEKVTKIRHSDYLAKAVRSFAEIGGCLFIYGHSLAVNDEHILHLIESGKLAQVYIGIYDNPESSANKAIIARAERLPASRSKNRPLAVSFFDSASAKVWG